MGVWGEKIYMDGCVDRIASHRIDRRKRRRDEAAGPTHTQTHPSSPPTKKHNILTHTKKGTDGVAGRDEERAIEYYTRAGAAGHGGALTTLGALFHQRGRYAEVCVGCFFLGGGMVCLFPGSNI